MCSHYQALKERERYIRAFGVEPPVEPGKVDLWLGYMGSFIRSHPYRTVGDESVPAIEAMSGMFWSGTAFGRQTPKSHGKRPTPEVKLSLKSSAICGSPSAQTVIRETAAKAH